MAKQTLVVGAVIAMIVVLASPSLVDVPQLIGFQGKLYDNAGNPLTGQYEVTLRIYDVEEGGTHLWLETINVECENGLYNVILGLVNALNLDFDGQYWLGVQVTGDDELSPRYRLVSVPTAFRAQVANQVSWTNLTDVPEGFSDGIDDEGLGNHDHWGESWEGSGTGLDLFAENDGIALDAYSEDNYAIEARSGGSTSLYGWTGLSGISHKAASIIGEGSYSHGVAGLSDKAYGVAGWSKEESGVYGYSSSYRGISGVSQDGTGVYGSSSEDNGVYGTSRGGSGVYGYNSSSSQEVNPAGVTGEGRHAPGVAGYSYDGYGLYGKSGENSPGVFGTSSGDSAIGVYGSGSGDYGYGVYGKHSSTYSGYGALGGLFHGVYGFNQTGAAVVGESGNLTEYGYYDVIGALANDDYLSGYGVFGAYQDYYGYLGSQEAIAGVYGHSQNGVGVSGKSTNNMGVVGQSTHDVGVYGKSDNNYGVHGHSSGGTGVYGSSTSSWAGYFAQKTYIGGNVGLQTESPNGPLHVQTTLNIVSGSNFVNRKAPLIIGDGDGSGACLLIDGNQIELADESDRLNVNHNSSANVVMVNGGGDVGIGYTNPSYRLDVNGTIRGSNVSPSDVRLKKEVIPIINALEKVSSLRGVNFKWKDEEKPDELQIGVIAQEVETVFPEAVSNDDDGYMSVAYGRLVAPLIEAIKELNTENEALKERIEALEAKLQE